MIYRALISVMLVFYCAQKRAQSAMRLGPFYGLEKALQLLFVSAALDLLFSIEPLSELQYIFWG
jgi:hypothetical protein